MSADEEILGKAYDARLARRLWPYLRPYRKAVAASVFLVPLFNAFQLARPWLVKRAIDQHIAVRQADGLGWIAAAYLAALAFEFLTLYGQVVLLSFTGQAVVRDLRRDLFGHVLGRAPRFFDRTPSGRLLTRLTNDLEGIVEMFTTGVVSLAADVVKLAAITGILFYLNWRLALTTLVVAPPLYFIVRDINGRMRAGFREVRTRTARLNAYLAEALNGMDIVQAFTQERRIQAEFAALGEEYRRASYDTVKQDARLYAIVEFVSAVAVAIILWYGGIRVVDDGLTFGALVAFVSYIQMFFDPIRDLAAKYATMQAGMASLERVFALQDDDEHVPAARAPIAAPQRAAHHGAAVAFEGVWFTYHAPTGAPVDEAGGDPGWVLRNLSFAAAAGESVALVGATGSGKSTTIKLLNRFYDPQRGRIRFDGVDVRELPLGDLRRRVGVVSQDVFLFTGSIFENVRLFDPAISRAQVEAACEAVGLLPMLKRLGRSLDEPMLERGRNLSQGQRQLVSFARVLAYDPQVLVLDEATSSVDQETEHLIQEALTTVMRGRTSLIVAHRLATIRHCNRIVVLHHGELRESGTHDELVAHKGLYEKLVRLQATEE